MSETSLPNCAEPPSSTTAACDPVVDEARSIEQRSDRIAHELLARFVLDPTAFAETTHASDAATFVRTYLDAVDVRISLVSELRRTGLPHPATLGLPRVSARDAARAEAAWQAEMPAMDDGNAPRMGAAAAVMVVAVVATVAVTVAVGPGMGIAVLRRPIPL